MITAKEAKAIYDESGVEAEHLMNQFEPKIVEEAKKGHRTAFVLLGSQESFLRLQPTPLHTQVMDKLSALGYRVSFTVHGGTYVPRGLANDDGEGPTHQNYGFAIHW